MTGGARAECEGPVRRLFQPCVKDNDGLGLGDNSEGGGTCVTQS